MLKWLVPMVVLVIFSPSLSSAETWEDFQRIKGAAEKSTLVPKGALKLIRKDIIVQRLRKRGEVTFNSDSILFYYGSPEIREVSYPQLHEIASALKQAIADPELSRIRRYYVDGHCCSIGSEQNNCRLSWARAHAVIDRLMSLGVPGKRLAPRGYGYFYPAYSNATEATRRLNRRVVLKGYLPGHGSDDPPVPCAYGPYYERGQGWSEPDSTPGRRGKRVRSRSSGDRELPRGFERGDSEKDLDAEDSSEPKETSPLPPGFKSKQ